MQSEAINAFLLCSTVVRPMSSEKDTMRHLLFYLPLLLEEYSSKMKALIVTNEALRPVGLQKRMKKETPLDDHGNKH